MRSRKVTSCDSSGWRVSLSASLSLSLHSVSPTLKRAVLWDAV